MKALSIKQPWASLIASGVKDIENRTWKTNFRGNIFIHASASWDARTKSRNALDTFTWDQFRAIPDKVSYEFLDSDIIVIDNMTPVSAIIGEVEIVDCVINHDSIWADKMKCDVCPNTGLHILRKGQKYIWNWVLENAVLYDQPILNVKGKLSLWEFEK